jgi:hypothetical protein
VPLFPPGTPVTVLVDGRPLAAYTRAYLIGNRVYAAVSPLLTRLADRLWVDGDVLVVERDGRRVRTLLQGGYVRAGVVLRGLGVPAHYEPAGHRLIVTTPLPAPVASPTPFNSAVPRVAPSAVFTPLEPATPRPIWTGSPLPRRTAVPVPPPYRQGLRTHLARDAPCDGCGNASLRNSRADHGHHPDGICAGVADVSDHLIEIGRCRRGVDRGVLADCRGVTVAPRFENRRERFARDANRIDDNVIDRDRIQSQRSQRSVRVAAGKEIDPRGASMLAGTSCQKSRGSSTPRSK